MLAAVRSHVLIAQVRNEGVTEGVLSAGITSTPAVFVNYPRGRPR